MVLVFAVLFAVAMAAPEPKPQFYYGSYPYSYGYAGYPYNAGYYNGGYLGYY